MENQNNYLQHHGIKGQRWGVRRYQNPDGTLTEEGKKRYSEYETKLNDEAREYTKEIALRNYSKEDPRAYMTGLIKKADSNAKESYSRGQKLINKMHKEGLINDKITFNDFIKKYELKLINDNLDNYRKFVKEEYGRDLTERDIEWMYYMFSLPVNDSVKHSDTLQHHGVKGQKWGVRKDHESSQDISETDNSEYEEKRQKRERNKKIFIGVALTAAGIAAISTLVKRFKNKSASQTISENKATITVGKEYVTNYSNVPIKNLESSRRLGIKNYMGKNRSYNIHFK